MFLLLQKETRARDEKTGENESGIKKKEEEHPKTKSSSAVITLQPPATTSLSIEAKPQLESITKNRIRGPSGKLNIYLFIYVCYYLYLLYKNLLPPMKVTTHQCHEKRENGKKKGVKRWKNSIEAQRAKPLTPSRVIDALIRDEEQTGKKEEKTTK